MLEKIYVLLEDLDKHKAETDVFRENMQAQGISVICMTCIEKNGKNQWRQQPDSLLVTDFSPEKLCKTCTSWATGLIMQEMFRT